jgi:RNA polymerase sigma-70 factor, ECF subfamily
MSSEPPPSTSPIVAAFAAGEAERSIIEAAFSDLIQSGRALWPNVTIDETSFAERVYELCRDRPSAASIGELHPDVLLAEGALAGDRHALSALDGLIRSAAERAALRGAPSDELAQRVREQLLWSDSERAPKLTQYSGKGPLGAWLRVLVTRTGLTMQRGENRRSAKLTDDDALANAPALETSPELQMLRSAYAGPFRDAFRDALRALSPEDRNMLRLHLVDGLGIDQLAPIYGVHRATAARRLVRAKETVLASTRQILQQRLGIADSDFTSLVGMMLSRIEVSTSFLDSR